MPSKIAPIKKGFKFMSYRLMKLSWKWILCVGSRFPAALLATESDYHDFITLILARHLIAHLDQWFYINNDNNKTDRKWKPTAGILFSWTKAIETSAWLIMNSTAVAPVMSKTTQS
jgi:hypothetical protein